MKLLILLLAVAFISAPRILLIDIGMKNEIKSADDFTIDDYFKKSFPVYADDVQAVIDGTIKMAKTINRNEVCADTINANHTMIYLRKDCGSNQAVSVRFVTKLEGKNTYFDFELVRGETDRRMAQQKLLNLAEYLGR